MCIMSYHICMYTYIYIYICFLFAPDDAHARAVRGGHDVDGAAVLHADRRVGFR